MTKIGTTSIDLFPLCLGGKVFGWTAEERRGANCWAAWMTTVPIPFSP